ncbi:Mobile element protein [Fimbriiglobus ruber]|uniref:Mobile element protein n=1 Tax=Fimbriiglobus ruber TaxID=1908690 RepID=A0A225D491_9BACT|nr:Mobile element protein [Fimbriiglobus ruber]
MVVRSPPGGAVGDLVPPPGATTFQPLRVRWVVERTFAWIGRCRRNSKDYERTESSSEAMVQVSSIRLMLRRLNKCA